MKNRPGIGTDWKVTARGTATALGVCSALACSAAPGTGFPPTDLVATGGAALPGAGGALPLGSGGAPPVEPPPGTGGQGGATVGPLGSTPPPAYDPNVHFEWPESVAQAGSCEAGTYTGTYECRIDFNGVQFVLDGQVTFQLTPSQNGEFLEIQNGKLAADVEGSLKLSGDLAGKLDCATNRFEASIQSGIVSFVFIIPFESGFTGDLKGDLDRLTSTMNGNWTLASTQAPPGTAGASCTGPWSVTRQP